MTDFCLWAPPSTTSDYGDSAIGNTERIEVAWCTQPGRGTRVIPAGAITGAHFVQTEHYVQITGVGDLTKLNIPAGDDGGELDPHGADGLVCTPCLLLAQSSSLTPFVFLSCANRATPSEDSSSRRPLEEESNRFVSLRATL